MRERRNKSFVVIAKKEFGRCARAGWFLSGTIDVNGMLWVENFSFEEFVNFQDVGLGLRGCEWRGRFS